MKTPPIIHSPGYNPHFVGVSHYALAKDKIRKRKANRSDMIWTVILLFFLWLLIYDIAVNYG